MISVALATHNEADNLKPCLQAVQDLADEIVIVDGLSTDQTREIAQEFNAKIIKTSNKPNFHINKQIAMDEAQGELVLQLDADEVVDQELKNFIIAEHRARVIKKNKAVDAQPVAWYLKRKNFFLGKVLKKGGQYPDPVIRLYVNGFAQLPQENVHEQMRVDGQIGWADGHLLHYSNPTFKDYWQKFKFYTSFQARRLLQQGIKPSLLKVVNYLLFKPIFTFMNLFIRHSGFIDGWRGFVFAAMSAFHHPVVIIKLINLKRGEKKGP